MLYDVIDPETNAYVDTFDDADQCEDGHCGGCGSCELKRAERYGWRLKRVAPELDS